MLQKLHQKNTPQHKGDDTGEALQRTLIADAPKAGFRAVPMRGGKVSATERASATPPFLIMEAVARAVRSTLRNLAPHPKGKANAVVDNTSLMGVPEENPYKILRTRTRAT